MKSLTLFIGFFALSLSFCSTVISAQDAEAVDIRLKEELGNPDYKDTYEKIKRFMTFLEAKNVRLEQLPTIISPFREEFVNSIVYHTIDNRSEQEQYDWVHHNVKKDGFTGREILSTVVNMGIVRDCRHVNNNLNSLKELKFNPTLQSQISKETLLWLKIQNVCKFLINDVHNGKLYDDIYETFLRIYKQQHQNCFKKLIEKLI